MRHSLRLSLVDRAINMSFPSYIMSHFGRPCCPSWLKHTHTWKVLSLLLLIVLYGPSHRLPRPKWISRGREHQSSSQKSIGHDCHHHVIAYNIYTTEKAISRSPYSISPMTPSSCDGLHPTNKKLFLLSATQIIKRPTWKERRRGFPKKLHTKDECVQPDKKKIWKKK